MPPVNERLQMRPVLALAAMSALNFAMRDQLGAYSALAMLLAIIALVLALSACLLAEHSYSLRIRPVFLFGVVAGLMAIVGAGSTYLLFLEFPDTLRVARLLAAIGCAWCLAFFGLLAWRRWQDSRWIAGWLVVAIALGAGIRGAAIVGSPEPVIDAFAMLRDHADHVLAGRNPYTSDIISPYGTPAAERHGIVEPADPRPAGYPPHPYLIAAPFRWLGIDPRWANVLNDMLAAITLFLIGTRRGGRTLGCLVAAIWLFLPLSSVMISGGWYEPMLAGLFGLGFWLTESTGWRHWVGFALLGLALTAKQFGAAMLPALAWPMRRQWRPILLGSTLGAAVMLPWFLWSPRDFIECVAGKHLDRPAQHERAITVAAAWYRTTGTVLPREALWAIAGMLIAWISGRGPKAGAATALGLGAALLTFCLFHTQAFLNYFYLVQYLLLLGAVGSLPRRDGAT